MATNETGAAPVYALTRAADGFRNGTAVVSILLGLVFGWVFGGLLMAMAVGLQWGFFSVVLSILAAAAFLLFGLGGISAAGIQLRAQVVGEPPRSLLLGLFEGVWAAIKLIAIALILLLVGVLVMIPVALVLLLCKIPGLGPVLYAVMVPVLSIGIALFYAGLFVAWQLMGPAVWEGNSIMGSIAKLTAIARERALEVIINLVLLALLVIIAGWLLIILLGGGLMTVTGMSFAIIGSGPPLDYVADFGRYMDQAVDGYGFAFLIGGGFLALLAATFMLCPMLMGLNIIYANASSGIDASEIEGKLSQGLQQAKAKTAQGYEQAKVKAAQVQQATRERVDEMQRKAREARSSPQSDEQHKQQPDSPGTERKD